MAAYRQVFISESAENVESIVDGLLRLESDPGDLEPVEAVFRGAHSLKGMAGAMGYDRAAGLTHKMESLMDRAEKGRSDGRSLLRGRDASRGGRTQSSDR